MNLHSPIFDVVRVPARASLARLVDRVCKEHGIEASDLRQRRRKHETNKIMEVRREVLVAARAAKYGPAAIGNWFGHRDGETISNWLSDLGVE